MASTFPISVTLGFAPPSAEPDGTTVVPTGATVYAFGFDGQLLARAATDDAQALLHIPTDRSGQSARIFVGPPEDAKSEPQSVQSLMKGGALERRVPLDPARALPIIDVPDPIWRRWKLCRCTVTGRVVTRVTMPDGSVQELPVCSSVVHIGEVDRLPLLIRKLPDPDLFRLRDELVAFVRERPPVPGPLPIERVKLNVDIGIRKLGASLAKPKVAGSEMVRALAEEADAPMLRQKLMIATDSLRDYVISAKWLDRFFRLRVTPVGDARTDENGRFSLTIWYPCGGDKPDLYFTVDQTRAGVVQRVYEPPVRTSTHWNYACGSDVTIEVTDPRVEPCIPRIPNDIPGTSPWVLVYSVGGTLIRGNPLPAPLTPSRPGWLKQNGRTDYRDPHLLGGTDIVDAPFGSTLSFRIDHGVKMAPAMYYRFSYRQVGAAAWIPMTADVYKHYVREVPSGTSMPVISYPAYQLGPRSVGTEQALFELRPATPPPPEAGAPTGTFHHWPVNDPFAELYAASFDSTRGVAVVGDIEVLFELFDAAGVRLTPGGPVGIYLPTGFDFAGTLQTRLAQPAEVASGGLVFPMRIDNQPCALRLDRPSVTSGTTTSGTTDGCGFLHYRAGDAVRLSFNASHPSEPVYFQINISHGSNDPNPTPGSASGRTRDNPVGPYANLNGLGEFAAAFDVATFLGTCATGSGGPGYGAYYAALGVYATVTNGIGRLGHGYDASTGHPFAIAPGA